MDESNKLACSRRGHKSHLSKIMSNVQEILTNLSETKQETPDATLSSSDAVLLEEYSKQLKLKASVFAELDEKIIEKTDDEKKLEDAVFESADLQAMLSEKIALISHILEVDSPRRQVRPQSVTANTHKDTRDEPQPSTHSSEAGNGRDSPPQDHTEKSLPSQQESPTVHLSEDRNTTSAGQSLAHSA